MPHLSWIESCVREIDYAEYDLDEQEQNEYSFIGSRFSRSLCGPRERVREAYRELEEAKKSIRIIGYICVQYKLPAGDPCWMAKMIGSFV